MHSGIGTGGISATDVEAILARGRGGINRVQVFSDGCREEGNYETNEHRTGLQTVELVALLGQDTYYPWQSQYGLRPVGVGQRFLAIVQ